MNISDAKQWQSWSNSYDPPPSAEKVSSSNILWLKRSLEIFFRIIPVWDSPVLAGFFHAIGGALLPCTADSKKGCPLCKLVQEATSSGADPKFIGRFRHKFFSVAWIWLARILQQKRADGKKMYSVRENSPMLLIAPGGLASFLAASVKNASEEDVKQLFLSDDGPLLRLAIRGPKQQSDCDIILSENITVDLSNIPGNPDDLLKSIQSEELQQSAKTKLESFIVKNRSKA